MLQDYLFARDAAHALELLTLPGAMPVAGGTSFTAGAGPRGPRLVDLTRAGLDTLSLSAGQLRIGAALRVADLLASPIGREFAGGLLAKAAAKVGSPQIRNLATVGGNLMAGHAWSCLPPALLALDATLVFRDAAGESRLAYSSWLAGKPAGSGPRLLTGIELPEPDGRFGAGYADLRKSRIDFPLVTVAAAGRFGHGRVSDLRVAVSACTRRPLRLTDFEAIVAAAPLDPDRTARLAREASAAVEIVASYRLSTDYGRAVLAELVARAVEAVTGEGERA